MKKINDYLYSGDTVLKILYRYAEDLKQSSKANRNQIYLVHCHFLLQIAELWQHSAFLTSQSQRILEFYHMIDETYPFLAFTFKGRIKSLIRAEAKFNGYIVEYIYDYYIVHQSYPSLPELKQYLTRFRDLIAYRLVVSLPKCHLKEGENREEAEKAYLYKMANLLPDFLEERGFTAEISSLESQAQSPLLDAEVRAYYRDYVMNPMPNGYQSLHITFYDISARCYVEVQLRTKEMDDFSEIGPANHFGYEKRQENERARREAIPIGDNRYFDEAYERGMLLQNLELSELDVNMFSAVNNSLINDSCGLYRGRLILLFDHFSQFESEKTRNMTL